MSPKIPTKGRLWVSTCVEPILCGPCLWVPLLSTWPATHEPFLGRVLRTQMGLVATVVGLGMSSCCGTGRKLRDTRGPSPTLVLLASAPHQEAEVMDCGCPLPCCWDTFVPVNSGPWALVTRPSRKAGPDMENARREATRPFVPSGTLELYFPDHLYRWVPVSGTSPHPDPRPPFLT